MTSFDLKGLYLLEILKKIRLELSEEGSCSIGASQHAYEPKDEVLVSVHFRH
jgi:hypothetical protein